MDQKKIVNKNILIISPELWSNYYISKHNYAIHLAQKNNVWFLNSCGDPSLSKKVDIEHFPEVNVNVVKYKNVIRGISKLPLPLLNILLKKQIKLIEKNIGVQLDIVWSFDPNRFWNLSYWNCTTRIYHPVDFHLKAKYQHITCKTADVVLGIADLILDPIAKHNKHQFKINHGVNLTNYSDDIKKINLPGKNNLKVSYLGNFHKSIDYKLLSVLIESNPAVDFILIGPYKGSALSSGNKINKEVFDKLNSHQNTYFIGEIPSTEIIPHLNASDINLILFKEEKAVAHCNPHKTMSYLLSGKVIVASYIDEYKDTDVLEMEKFNKDINNKLKEVIKNIDFYNNEEHQAKRIQFAKSNSYNQQIDRIGTIINQLP